MIRKETIDGFNEFIKAQQEQMTGECYVKLVQFDHEYLPVYDLPLNEVPLLNPDSYIPRGSTALYDAIGRTIASLGERLKKKPEAKRPEKVIVVIITDGFENSSREYKYKQIADMIKHQTEKYSWSFMYLGANQDAIASAEHLNIPGTMAMSYGLTGQSVRSTYASLSRNTVAVSTGDSTGFTQEERKNSA